MKYILNEDAKYLLNEGKYLLSERFLLNEDAINDYTDFKTKLSDLLKKLKELINAGDASKAAGGESSAELEKTAKEIVDKTTEMLGSVSNTNSTEQIADYLNRYFIAINAPLKKLDKGFADFKDTDGNSGSNELQKAFYGVYALFKRDGQKKLKIFDKLRKKKLLDEIRRAAAIAVSYAKNAKTVATVTGEDTDEETTEMALMQAYSYFHKMASAAPDEASYNANFKGTVFSDKIDKAHKALKKNDGELIKSCISLAGDDTFKDDIRKIKIPDGVKDDAEGDLIDKDSDWGKRYREAADKDKVWKQFLNAAFGDNADKVMRLGKPFRNECEVYGFDSEPKSAVNPFIRYVYDHLIAGDNLNVDEVHYTQLHNAIAVQHALDPNDLVAPKQPYSKENMPFFKQKFFDLPPTDSKYYITEVMAPMKQDGYGILPNSTDGLPEANKNIIENLKGCGNATNLLSQLLYLGDSLENLKKAGYDVTEVSSDAAFRPISEAQSLMKALNQKDAARKVISADGLQSMINDIDKSPLLTDNAAKKDFMQNVIICLLDAIFNDVAGANKLKDDAKLSGKVLTKKERVEASKFIGDYAAEFPLEKVRALVNKLNNVDWWKGTTP